MGWVVP
ncbi:unnamed protein product, partial [Cuscuta epithymum]